MIEVAILVAIAAGVIAWYVTTPSYSNVRNIATSGRTMIAFGDSMVGPAVGSSGPNFSQLLSRKIGGGVMPAVVDGDTTESALRRLQTDVIANDPAIVIVGLGGNDFHSKVPIAKTEENLRLIVRRLHDAGAVVVLLGCAWPGMTEAWDTMYQRIATETSSVYISARKVFENDANRGSDSRLNADGYEALSKVVARPMKILVKTAVKARSNR